MKWLFFRALQQPLKPVNLSTQSTVPAIREEGNHVKNFYSILGKVLSLALIADAAYQQSKVGGPSSLLIPENLAALIQAAEGVLVPAPVALAVVNTGSTTGSTPATVIPAV